MQAPNQELIIVASRGQLLLIVTPLEAADFLLVPDQLGFEVVLGSQVSVQDAFVSRT